MDRRADIIEPVTLIFFLLRNYKQQQDKKKVGKAHSGPGTEAIV
jgi:hypothetical protein